jgi:hypothetical protein
MLVLYFNILYLDNDTSLRNCIISLKDKAKFVSYMLFIINFQNNDIFLYFNTALLIIPTVCCCWFSEKGLDNVAQTQYRSYGDFPALPMEEDLR